MFFRFDMREDTQDDAPIASHFVISLLMMPFHSSCSALPLLCIMAPCTSFECRHRDAMRYFPDVPRVCVSAMRPRLRARAKMPRLRRRCAEVKSHADILFHIYDAIFPFTYYFPSDLLLSDFFSSFLLLLPAHFSQPDIDLLLLLSP